MYDLAIIGGGINGCGIARDAAGRGLSVYLCDQGDLGGATSSASTKLIHGGLRYLELYEFRLVREALVEREVLLRAAPHIVRPLRFVLPHHSGLRPRWLLRLGLFIYDHLGGRRMLPPTRTLDLRHDAAGRALKPSLTTAFEYSDCWVDDSRLVVLNALDAAGRGASINPRVRCVSAQRESDHWSLSLEDVRTGVSSGIKARTLVNAAGPWVEHVVESIMRAQTPTRTRLIKGSHIVVPRIFDHDRAYILQNADGRVVFAIPYERDFTLIGTTDEAYEGNPVDAHADAGEIRYLCEAASDYFATPVRPESVVMTYSGVRPLLDDGAANPRKVTRDYLLESDDARGRAPLINVFGGKITTYRRLAEHALEELGRHLDASGPWTASAPLPGGDFPAEGIDAVIESLAVAYPFLRAAHVERLARSYGTRANRLLNGARSYSDLGRSFGADLTEAEIRFLVTEEWALTADDILWRRTKLGLHMRPEERAAVAEFLANTLSSIPQLAQASPR